MGQAARPPTRPAPPATVLGVGVGQTGAVPPSTGVTGRRSRGLHAQGRRHQVSGSWAELRLRALLDAPPSPVTSCPHRVIRPPLPLMCATCVCVCARAHMGCAEAEAWATPGRPQVQTFTCLPQCLSILPTPQQHPNTPGRRTCQHTGVATFAFPMNSCRCTHNVPLQRQHCGRACMHVPRRCVRMDSSRAHGC